MIFPFPFNFPKNALELPCTMFLRVFYDFFIFFLSSKTKISKGKKSTKHRSTLISKASRRLVEKYFTIFFVLIISCALLLLSNQGQNFD